MILKPENLTTPEKIDKNVSSFCRTLSTEAPIYIDVRPEPWSKQSNCEMNVDKFIELHGGDKIIGYKIWYTKRKYIEAERHVVYKKESEFIDLTFNTDGERKILFIPDDKKLTYDERPLKLRRGLTQKARILAKKLDERDANILQMTQEDSWNTMPSFEEWLKGKRMPNMIPVPINK